MKQLKVLLYKNWLLYKRAPLGNCCEIFCPLAFTCIIVFIHLLTPSVEYAQQSLLGTSYAQTVASYSSQTAYLKSCENQVVGVSPQGDLLVQKIETMLTNFGYQSILFSDETAFEDYIRSDDYQQKTQLCFGVTVQNSTDGNFSYSLRFNITDDTNVTDGPWTTLPLTQDKEVDYQLYAQTVKHGMIGMNILVHTAILQLQQNSNTQFIANQVSPIYQNQYSSSTLFQRLKESVGIIMLIPLLVIYLRQIYFMLVEKQSKLRETMYTMGMSRFSYYFSWFIRYFAAYLVISLLIAIQLSSVFDYMPFFMLFVINISFSMAMIAQLFFIQVFTTRAKIGIYVASIFFAVQYVFSLLVAQSDSSITINTAVSAAPHTAFIIAYRTLLYCQNYKITPTFLLQINFYKIIIEVISSLAHSLIFFILTWYFDQVYPNQWGARRHPLFCCNQKTVSTLNKQEKEYMRRQVRQCEEYSRKFEKLQEMNRVQEEQEQAIEMVKLRKQFGDNKFVAVNDLTVSMFQGQIFVLLGHNGAGKTTTVSMFSGMIEPTSGYMSVFGETETEMIRKQLSICPQHDTLYDDLTVQEHLQMFAAFKGLKQEDIQEQIQRLIVDVNLQQKRHEYTKKLSGGQKRKLSVAIAFTGRSKVIVLDEPTSGMDTSARRFIWDLLKRYKNDRIILLTTHFMDEADFLGDRIGIMGDGKMLCCGSSVFLKNTFGHGYSINFTKNSEASSNPILSVIKKHIFNSELLANMGTNLVVQLPLSESSNFPALFSELDQRKQELGFSEYGLRISTLEEVFLQVANQKQKADLRQTYLKNIENEAEKVDHDVLIKDKNKSTRSNEGSDTSSALRLNNQEAAQEQRLPDNFDFDDIPRVQSYFFMFLMHFKATILKRIRISRRDIKFFILELLVPFLLILMALFMLKVSFLVDFQSRAITVDTYLTEQNPVVIPISSDSSSYLSELETNIKNMYGSKVNVLPDTVNQSPATFDQVTLLPLRLSTKTLKGGIFFYSTPTLQSDGSTIYSFTTLISTRTQESPFFLANIATEALLNAMSHNVSIKVTNKPMPRTQSESGTTKDMTGFFASFFISVGLGFKLSSTIAFIIKERISRSKHLMVISGMNIKAYWLANFTFDFLLYMIITCLSIGATIILEVKSLTAALGLVWALYILYALSQFPLVYIISFYLDEETSFFNLTLIIGGLLPALVAIIRVLTAETGPIIRGFAWLFRLYPSFAFGEGMVNISSVLVYGRYQNNWEPLDPYDMEVAIAPIIYLGITSIFYFGLLLVIQELKDDEHFLRRFLEKEKNVEQTQNITESDVLHQRELALAPESTEHYTIVSQNIRKVYIIDGPEKHKVAVDNLSFGIKKGEVFGLLGVNGGGKTSFFKILSGQVTSTYGDCFINGLKIYENLDTIRWNLGYVPQFDALVQSLTVHQHMDLFYDIKSFQENNKEKAIYNKLNELNLTAYRDKICGNLSGGNKRKLSVALAMLGNPSILLLDEPSTGMDPKSRRYMWKVIGRVASENKNVTVVLTTHNMDQAQALSSRLAIMVKGNLRCIGTPQHIKHKYAQGLQLEIKLKIIPHKELIQMMAFKGFQSRKIKPHQLDQLLKKCQFYREDRERISSDGDGSFIHRAFETHGEVDSELIFEYFQICKKHRRIKDELKRQIGQIKQIQRLQSFIRLNMQHTPKMGKLFSFFEGNKKKFGIENYTIKEASLEQIFNDFAAHVNLPPIQTVATSSM